MKPARPMRAWAVVVRATRCEWINWTTVAMTRKGAWELLKKSYVEGTWPMLEKQLADGRFRLARVTLSLENTHER